MHNLRHLGRLSAILLMMYLLLHITTSGTSWVFADENSFSRKWTDEELEELERKYGAGNWTAEQLAELVEMARRGELPQCNPRFNPKTGYFDSCVDVRNVVLRAGESGNKDFIPAIEDIARMIARSRDGHHEIVCLAMHALWQLGCSSEYFLQKVREYDPQEIMVARYAIYMLARWPEDERLKAFLREFDANLENPQRLRCAAGAALLAWSMRDEYTGLRTLDEKISYLLEIVDDCSRLGLILIAPEDPSGGLRPHVFWARQELMRLSEEEPEAVGYAISRLYRDRDPDSFAGWTLTWAQRRANMATLVSEEAREIYEAYEAYEALEHGIPVEDETGKIRKKPRCPSCGVEIPTETSPAPDETQKPEKSETQPAVPAKEAPSVPLAKKETPVLSVISICLLCLASGLLGFLVGRRLPARKS